MTLQNSTCRTEPVAKTVMTSDAKLMIQHIESGSDAALSS